MSQQKSLGKVLTNYFETSRSDLLTARMELREVIRFILQGCEYQNPYTLTSNEIIELKKILQEIDSWLSGGTK